MSPPMRAHGAFMVVTPANIPAADLKEPFQNHTILALRWWLQCRGCIVPSSWKESQIISRCWIYTLLSWPIVIQSPTLLCMFYVHFMYVSSLCSLELNKWYLRERQLMLLMWMVVHETPAVVSSEWTTCSLRSSPPPPTGWIATLLKTMQHWLLLYSTGHSRYTKLYYIHSHKTHSQLSFSGLGLIYTYLAGSVGCTTDAEGAFWALKHGYIHWPRKKLRSTQITLNIAMFIVTSKHQWTWQYSGWSVLISIFSEASECNHASRLKKHLLHR